MIKLKNFKKGQILIIGIIFMALILLFSTTIFSKVSGFINFGAKSTEKKQAIHIAEAGIDLAIKRITDNPNYNPDPNQKNPIGSPPSGEFTVQLDTITPTKKTITVEAFVPNAANPKTKQKAQVTLNSTEGTQFPVDAESGLVGGCGHVHNDAFITNNILFVIGKRPPSCSGFESYQFQKQIINPSYELQGILSPTGTRYQDYNIPRKVAVPPEAGIVTNPVNGFIYSIGVPDGFGVPPATGNSKVFFNTSLANSYWSPLDPLQSLPDESTGNPALAGGTTGGKLSRSGFATTLVPVTQADTDALIVLIGGALGLCPDAANPCEKLSTKLVAEKNPGLGTLHPHPAGGFEDKGDINLGHPTWPKWWYSTAVVNNDKIYLLGGVNTDMVIYSTVATGDIGPFTENPNKLPKNISHASAVVANGYVFLFGGRSDTGGSTSTIIKDVYSAQILPGGNLGPFNIQTKLPLVLEDAGAAVLNNHIYITGGHTDPSLNGNVPVGFDTEYLRVCWRTVANADGTLDNWKDCYSNSDQPYMSSGGGSWTVDKSTFHLR